MSLSTLPPELIHLIAAASMPAGFESLMLSCKTVYEASKPLLGRHNSLRRNYSRVILDEDLASTIPLLLRICRDPLIAEYVEDIDLWNRTVLPTSADGMADAEINDLHWTEELSPHILQSACLNKPEPTPEDWVHELGAASGAMDVCLHASIVLVAVLPNLRHLTPSPHWQSSHDVEAEADSEPKVLWRKLLDTLVIRCNDAQIHSRPLQKLELIRSPFESGYESYQSLRMFSPFMSVPSVRTMRVASCKAVDDGYTGEPFEWVSHFPASNIARLELAFCCIDGPAIGEIVRHMPSLRVLRYSHETKWHGCLHDWDAGEFVAHVGKWCGEALTTLSITITELFGDSDGAAPFLKQFTALEHLEVDLRCLEAHTLRIEGNAGPPPAPAIHPAVPLETIDAIYSLGDILPNSVKSLRLYVPSSPGQYAFMQRLLSWQQSRPTQELSLLEIVEVCREEPPDGLIEHEDHDDADWHRLAEMLPSTIKYTYGIVTHTEAA